MSLEVSLSTAAPGIVAIVLALGGWAAAKLGHDRLLRRIGAEPLDIGTADAEEARAAIGDDPFIPLRDRQPRPIPEDEVTRITEAFRKALSETRATREAGNPKAPTRSNI